ncbi:MAG: PDDEXK nuclease domain-containing protein [Muribaculaceae bacterium]|nr:PDDEXK nuclease domain-containing protein [Muribaculaceae bacterium]
MAKSEKNPAFVKRDPIVSGKEYAQLLKNLKERFRRSQIKAAVKVNTEMLEFYWEMGRDVSELYKHAKYGSAFFDCLSLDLKAEFPNQTGFSATNIKYAKRWYDFYNQLDKNRQQLADDFIENNLQQAVEEFRHQLGDDSSMPVEFGQVPWMHHVYIFTHSESVQEALFYIDKTIENGWSRFELETEMDDDLYQKQGKAITNFDEKLPAPYSGLAKAILKSPYDLSFLDSKIKSERDLEDALAHDITRFLLELGQGFAYVGRQMELKMPGGQVFMPDMIFYNYKIKAFIVCELKVVPFMPEFVGKLNFYVSAADELLRQEDDNPSIGLLICKSKDNTMVEWSFRGMTQPLGVAEYKLGKHLSDILPSEKDLQRIIDTYYSDDN